MIAPGSIIIVYCIPVTSGRNDVAFVTIERNLGMVPGLGQLVWTEEGNYVLVSEVEHSAHKFLQRAVFITDAAELNRICQQAGF